MKNVQKVPESVLSRLLSYSKAHRIDYNSLLIRYIAERFLYRLGTSSYRDFFILKGAYLLSIRFDGQQYRTTKDIDFLKVGDSSTEALRKSLVDIVSIEEKLDGVVFDPDTMKIDPIREHKVYQGHRVKISSYIGKARLVLQIDIGIGDSISPAPVSYEIPSLLDLPDPTITSYPLESVVAEKLEAIFSIGMLNSRMKDFYDLYFISCKESFSSASLMEAVRCTFARRGTPFPENFPPVLSPTVIEDTVKQRQWEKKKKKI